MIIAIDFGITNTDIAVSNGGALDFFSFKTDLPIEESNILGLLNQIKICLLYTSPSPRDVHLSRMPSSA